jgi:hypothetical protein
MGDNKTRPTNIDIATFVNALSEPTKRSDAQAIIAMMKRATGEDPRMWGASIIGFGSVHYKYASGREGDTVLVGFSPRKPATVLYGVTGFRNAEAVLARLGKHSLGKGCLYIKKLSDVNEKVLEELITKSVAAKRGR